MTRPSILDPRFRYTSSAATDIRKTFARERKRLAAEKAKQEAAAAEAAVKVRPMAKKALP